MFDELRQIGLEALTKKDDLYWDVPLNENLPQPVIDLPMPKSEPDGSSLDLFGEPTAPKSKRRKTSRRGRSSEP